jgi:hypothetical protein
MELFRWVIRYFESDGGLMKHFYEALVKGIGELGVIFFKSKSN